MGWEVTVLAYRVLIADDEPDIRNLVSIFLQKNGYTVFTAKNGGEAVRELRQNGEFDLVIMDIMMPDMDGIRACREIRTFSTVPLLFLTAKTQEADKQQAYEIGGDDYLGKPFSQNELLMKVSSLIRRYRVYRGKEASSKSAVAGIEIETETHQVKKNGVPVNMTEKEYAILQFFLSHRGQPVDVASLYEGVWNEKYLPSSNNTVMVHILNLRKKLEDDPAQPVFLRTVWGKGYQID